MKNLIIGAVLATALLGGCTTQTSKFKKYNGPPVTRIFVDKSDRTMFLMNNNKVLKKYRVDLGFAPNGDKNFEGDGRTPEGLYYIDRRNPNSNFHLSLGISYPNRNDVALAFASGKNPGGDIFIHGGPRMAKNRGKPDWTAGCIAVTDEEIEEIYSMVQVGTHIYIRP